MLKWAGIIVKQQFSVLHLHHYYYYNHSRNYKNVGFRGTSMLFLLCLERPRLFPSHACLYDKGNNLNTKTAIPALSITSQQ